MTTDAFSEAMMLIIFCSFVVERSLALIYETEFFNQRFGSMKHIKPAIAIVYAMVFVLLVDLNLAAVIKDETSNGYVWCAGYLDFTWNMGIVLITGTFIAGGSKASLKLFRDVLGIQSSYAARMRQPIATAPADPPAASLEAAKGNKNAKELLFTMLDNGNLT